MFQSLRRDDERSDLAISLPGWAICSGFQSLRRDDERSDSFGFKLSHAEAMFQSLRRDDERSDEYNLFVCWYV